MLVAVLGVLMVGGPAMLPPQGRRDLKDWSYPYKVWLPYASYLNGGIAFHEAPDVPA